MKTIKSTLFTMVAAAALIPGTLAIAQTPMSNSATQGTAKIHGHITNPAGMAFDAGGEVKLTKDKTAAEKEQRMIYSFPIDKNGDYSGSSVAAGDYFAYVVQGDKHIDRLEVTIKEGDDKTLNFDMTREEYIKTMTDEQKKALEDYKKHASAAIADNKVIANLNATLKQVREDLTNAAKSGNPDVSKDVANMKQAVDARPNEALLQITYGDTLQAQGDHLAHDDRANKTNPATDDAVNAQYAAAVVAYKAGIDASAASKKPQPGDQAAAYNQMGNALAKSGKIPDAAAAFESAAKLMPASAGMYYNNEAAIMFNNNKADEAAVAADKAIAADPTRPDPYFIKGQALVQKATVDSKTGLPVAPPGCLEAYQKYLELAPNGPHAEAVKEVLTGFNQKIDTKYNANQRKK
ncbi:MAG TPA: hypothetical protein VGN16_13240 [Acidobacteriaceae bacterium]|jgi:tetratricopeptide (TPR) repeat protein